jgi:branched-chain amino acid aminotransferase
MVKPPSPFGTAFVEHMSVAEHCAGAWTRPELRPLGPLSLHPGAHALHYGSSCFEGLKAHRGIDDVVRVFRLGAHVDRLRASARRLLLPVPSTEMLAAMIIDLVRASLSEVPVAPGSLYLRPTLIGTDENIGAAAHPSSDAMLFVLASPVGSYFADGERPLVLAIETDLPRTTPQFGSVKAGANYVMALGVTTRAAAHFGADQVLFAPGGMVEETGASNVVLVDGERVITPALSEAFLHGVTRDSVLRIAAELGYVVEERALPVTELLQWAARPEAEVALTGTAAVMSSVGTLVLEGRSIVVGTGKAGPHTAALRQALTELHVAKTADRHGWLTAVAAERS